MRLRRIAAVAAVPLGIALLAGCSKPLPSVSAFSGATSANVEAICWSFDAAQSVDAATCLGQKQGQSASDLAADLKSKVGVIPVASDQTIGISVDPALQDGGWFPVIGQNRLTAEPVTSTYYRFQLTAADLRNGPLELRVLALGDTPDVVRGLWTFELQPSTGAATTTPSPAAPSSRPTKSPTKSPTK